MGEHQGCRGVNEIGSALFHYLSTKLPSGTRKVRLFSDNCPGQNENFPMAAMLSAFAARARITIDFFSHRGHSYLPADRASGRFEKRLRRHETILLPSGYLDEFRKEGEVLEYPAQWPRLDLKRFCSVVLKAKQAFKLSEQGRLVMSGSSTLFVSTDFRENLSEFSILKRGKHLSEFNPRNLVIEAQNRMKEFGKTGCAALIGDHRRRRKPPGLLFLP